MIRTPDQRVRFIVPYHLPARLATARAAGNPAVFDRGCSRGTGPGQSTAPLLPQDWPRRGRPGHRPRVAAGSGATRKRALNQVDYPLDLQMAKMRKQRQKGEGAEPRRDAGESSQ